MSHTITVAVCFRVMAIVFKAYFITKLTSIRESHLAKTDDSTNQAYKSHFNVGILSEKLKDLTITCLKWIPE